MTESAWLRPHPVLLRQPRLAHPRQRADDLVEIILRQVQLQELIPRHHLVDEFVELLRLDEVVVICLLAALLRFVIDRQPRGLNGGLVLRASGAGAAMLLGCAGIGLRRRRPR